MEGEALEGSQLACFKGFCRKRQIPPNYVAQAAQNYKGTGDCIDDRVGGVVYEAVAPDCINNGLTEGKHCAVCAEVLVAQKTVEALGHSYVANVTPATCTEDGYTIYTCKDCSDSYTADEIFAIGHRYIFTNCGDVHTISCANCTVWNHVESHRYFDGICLCGAREIKAPIIDESLVFNMDISAGAEMVINYNFMAGVVEKYKDFYLEVRKNVAEGEPVITIYGDGDGDGRNAMGGMNHPVTGEPLFYNASYNGINAKEMGDNFSTTLYAVDANGQIFSSKTVTSSIKDFLMSKIDVVSPQMNTMAVDMLKYGAAAQKRFNYDVGNLVTNDLTDKQLSYGTRETVKADDAYSVTGNGVNVTTNITIGSKVELSLSCIATQIADASNIKCRITDEEGIVLTELPTTNMSGVMFYAKYDNVGAKEMRKLIMATFYDGDRAVSKTVTWNVESYVAQVRANPDATAEEIALVDAMLAYGDSVAAYMVSTNQ